jgi:putative ABC transport system permease protein
MMNLIQDLRYALRQLRRSPGFTVTALLTLMLAIGATSAMVSVLRATLLNPTPYADAGQVVSVQDVNLKGFKANGLVSMARTTDIADAPAEAAAASGIAAKKVFSSSAFYYFDQPALVIDGRLPISVAALEASGDFFKVLGTQPLLGRWYTASDASPSAPRVAVISYGLWRRAFAASPEIIGKQVTLGGKPATIIGVMPDRFDYPGGTEVWEPGVLSYADFGGYRGEGSRFMNVIARISPGLSVDAAQRSLELLANGLGRRYPETDGDWGFKVATLRSQILGGYREGLMLLSAAVAMLLLIACANIAGLQLSRNAKRQPEIALRRALGVSTARLLQQLMTESLLLMVSGSALGVGLCVLLLRVFAASLPPALLSFADPKVDGVTLAVTISVGIVAGVLSGIVPALQFGKTSERDLMPSGQNLLVRATKRFDRAFATVQLALALVLLALASGLLQNLNGLLHVRLGYDTSHVLTTSVHLPFGTDVKKAHRFHQQFEQSLASLPGVESAGAISALPLASFMVPLSMDVEGQPVTPRHDSVTVESRLITPGYLRTLRIPLLAGRTLTERDAEPGALDVVMVNQRFASQYFPQGKAVGKHLTMARETAEIVGVVGDVRGTGGDLSAPIRPEIYAPEAGGWANMQFVVRTELPAAALEPAMRRALAGIDSGFALGPVTLLAGSVDHALLLPRLNTGLLTALAGLALLLALIGVYGVIAFSVAQRTREIGVRIALGSTRAAILHLLLLEATAILSAGVALGVAGAVLATRLLSAEVAGLQASIADTLAASSLLLTLAVLGASLIAARRAASIDPMEALRSE